MCPFGRGKHEELCKALGWLKPCILGPEFWPKAPSDFIIHKHLPAGFVTIVT